VPSLTQYLFSCRLGLGLTAALEWTEAITLIIDGHAQEELFFSVRQDFGEPELVNPTRAIVTINSWNRLAIAFRSVPGTRQPKLAVP
jgi:alkylhydroperoxidase family enzyme